MSATAAAAFVAEVERLDLDAGTRVALDHWRDLIADGRVQASEAAQIPAQAVAARDRLLAHLREAEPDQSLGVDEVHRRYPGVFQSGDIPGVTEVLVGIQHFRMVQRFSIGLDVPEVERWLRSFTPEEVLRRFERLEKWIVKYYKTNHDGNILTPVLLGYLAGKGDLDSKLGELDRLKAETRQGRFQIGNDLQRDLEFRRFVYEYTRVLEPLTYMLISPVSSSGPFGYRRSGFLTRPGRYRPPMTDEEMYAVFVDLGEVPSDLEQEHTLSERELAESRRAAYEAFEFLQFLREFRSNTTRHIVVLGNDRFGRQWVVEPIEEYLDGSFSLRYDRVRSGTSTRLAVPMVFPRSFVKELSDNMPHVVIVDGGHAPGDPEVMMLPRAVRDYANWFAVFNDVRAEGDGSRYQHESSFPFDHFPELQKWHEYAAAKEQLVEWVAPGPTYRVTSWAPELKREVIMGDERVPRQPTKFGGDRPLVVLANAIFYRTEGDDLPDALRGTTPRYFDDPQAHVTDSLVFGFGAHGLETRRKGTSTEKFVTIVQRHMKEEIARLEALSAGR